MPRPSVEVLVRTSVEAYIRTAVSRSSDEAPLNTVSVAKRLGFDRKTLKKYGLDRSILNAAKVQRQQGASSRRSQAKRSLEDALRASNEEVLSMRRRCEDLIAKICEAEGNAQRLGIDPAELWKPLVAPDHSLPHTYKRRQNRTYNR